MLKIREKGEGRGEKKATSSFFLLPEVKKRPAPEEGPAGQGALGEQGQGEIFADGYLTTIVAQAGISLRTTSKTGMTRE